MKKRSIIFISLIALILLAIGLILTANRREYVLLVSMDAFRWDYPEKFETPVLDSIASSGVRAMHMVPAFPSKTFPNHYTLATGLYPDHHGLVNNSFWAPDLDLFYTMGNRERVENKDFYFGEPIWNTAEKQGIKSASMFWVGTEAPVGGMQPTYWNRYDGSVRYSSRVDSVIHWLSLPRRLRPNLVTLYFDEPDGISHDFGPLSAETDSVVVMLDSLLGELCSRLNKLSVAKKVNIVIVSDHGMGEISNERLVNLWKIIPEDWISGRSGSNPVYLLEPAEGKQDSILAVLEETEGVNGYTRETMPPELHYGTNVRIPAITVVADSLWSVVWAPREGYSLRSAATHGWDPAYTAMHGIFFASGRSFNKNQVIDEMHNVDLYNILCRVLKLDPAENDGDPLLYKEILK